MLQDAGRFVARHVQHAACDSVARVGLKCCMGLAGHRKNLGSKME